MELNMGYETFISKKCWKAACHNYHLICFFHQYPSANNLNEVALPLALKMGGKGHDTPGTPPSTLPPSYAIQPHVWGPSMASCCGVMAWSRSLKELKTGLDELEEICREKSLPLKPMLVMVGWAGNDVWGKAGYKGVPWIHQAKFNKTQADQEVSANWCKRQRAEVDKQVTQFGALKNADPRNADILMLSNADAEDCVKLGIFYVRFWLYII